MNPNDAAYPAAVGLIPTYLGLTKREIFIMAAMQGFCANSKWFIDKDDAAACAVAVADATIRAANKAEKETTK